MSHSGLCRLQLYDFVFRVNVVRVNVVRVNVAFVYVSFRLMPFGKLSFGLMSFVLLSVNHSSVCGAPYPAVVMAAGGTEMQISR